MPVPRHAPQAGARLSVTAPARSEAITFRRNLDAARAIAMGGRSWASPILRQERFEFGREYADGVRNAHMRQLVPLAQPVDCGGAYAEALSDLLDREQALDIRMRSPPPSKFLHRFFAEIFENGGEWQERLGRVGRGARIITNGWNGCRRLGIVRDALRLIHTAGVAGSNPAAPTRQCADFLIKSSLSGLGTCCSFLQERLVPQR